MRITFLVLALLVASSRGAVAAQHVLDRVVARVEGEAITLSDTRAAIRLGLVDMAEGVDPILLGMRQLVERRLVLAEVARFAPAEPDTAALAAEMAGLKARIGGAADVALFERTTGVGEDRIREIARDNLRMRAYTNQRFASLAEPTEDEVGQYYRDHLDDFRAAGRVTPFVEAEPVARQRATAERRGRIILQWMRDLRQRADVVELYP